jgi:hypothetical protein
MKFSCDNRLDDSDMYYEVAGKEVHLPTLLDTIPPDILSEAATKVYAKQQEEKEKIDALMKTAQPA